MFPWTPIVRVIFVCYWLVYWLLLVSAIRFILNVIRGLLALRRHTDKLAITIVLDTLRNMITGKNKDISVFDKFKKLFERGRYSIFLRFADSLSKYLSKISLIVISLIVISIAVVYNIFIIVQSIMLNVRYKVWTYSMLSFGSIAILIGLFVFIYPQIFMYQLLKNYKYNLITLLESIYEVYFLRYLMAKDITSKESILTAVDRLESALDYARSIRTLPFGLAQAIKVLSIILLWIQLGIMQILG